MVILVGNRPVSPANADQLIDNLTTPGQMIAGQYQPVPLGYVGPDTPLADPASDECDTATSLDLTPATGDGGQTIVNSMTENTSDPDLSSCVWGSPPNPRGYRTVWYQFLAPTSGRLVVTTDPNANYNDNYDTIVAIYSGDATCSTLTLLDCRDDTNGFLGSGQAWVQQGQRYYIEVADWQFGVNGAAVLNVSAYIDSTDRFWQVDGLMSLARSRHATAIVGDDIYVIGGQTVVSGQPLRTPQFDRYDTTTGQWTQLPDHPGPDGLGYSNGAAAHINGRIYIPAGYIGGSNYDGTHWVYDIAGGFWTTTTPAPWAGGTPVGYYATAEAPDQDGYYVIGGLVGNPFSGNSQPSGDWYFFQRTSVADVWFSFSTTLQRPRFGHVVANLNGLVCAAGGIAANNVLLNDTECFDGNQWQSIGTGNLNFPRYYAQSDVGPDGRWYMWGGINAQGFGVAEIEVFDPATLSWNVLEPRHDLEAPTRAWASGGFVGDVLWVIGGETAPGSLVVNQVEHLLIPQFLSEETYLPFLQGRFPGLEPHDTFAQAVPLYNDVVRYLNFGNAEDFFDMYYFDLAIPQTVTLDLKKIPAGADYDLLLYTPNKYLIESSTNIGQTDEQIIISLDAGRYYVLVVRAFPGTGIPPSDPYAIRLRY